MAGWQLWRLGGIVLAYHIGGGARGAAWPTAASSEGISLSRAALGGHAGVGGSGGRRRGWLPKLLSRYQLH